MHIDAVRRCAALDGLVDGLGLDGTDVLRRGVGHNALNDIAHHRQCHTDGGNDLGVFGDGVAQPHLVRAEADQSGCAAADTNQTDLVFFQAVLGGQLGDDRLDLLVGAGQDLGGDFLDRLAHVVRQRLHGLAGSVGVAVGEVVGGNQPQHVRGTGVRDGDALAACQFNGNIVVGVALLRGEEDDLRVNDFLLRGKDGVVHTGDVRRARTDILDAALVSAHHRAARNAQHADVQTADVGAVTADDGVVNGGATVLDDADVRCRAADLKVNAVGRAQVHQAAHDRSGGAGQHRQDGTLFHLADLHNAAVAAHDHQGDFHARAADAFFRLVGGVQHLGQNGSVDGRGAGAAGQAVQLGDFAGGGGFQPHLLSNAADAGLVLHIIHAVDLAGDDDLCALAGQLLNRSLDRCIGQGIIDEIAVMQVDGTAGAEVNVLQIRLRLCDPATGTFAADADDADLCDVTLDQGVRRLRGGMGDEDNVLRVDVILFQAVFERLHNTGGNTGLVVMGGLDRGFADDLVGRVVDGDGLGVGAADVDAHAYFSFTHFPIPPQPNMTKVMTCMMAQVIHA